MRRILLSLLLLPALILAEIIETPHISEVVPLVDAKTWLIVDLDNTTFEAAQALGHTQWFEDLVKKRVRMGESVDTAIKESDPLWFKVQQICPVKPMEKDYVPSIIDLQNKKVVVFALTHRQPQISNATLRQVASIGLDFTRTAPSKDTFTLSLPKEPIYYHNGILYANDFNPKGETLLAFIKKIGKKPAKVVFVDDSMSNVKDMDATLNKEGIPNYCVHYTAKKFVPPVFFPDIAAFQEKFLYRIMSNDAALLLMRNKLE